MITKVEFSKNAYKQIKKIPAHIQTKLATWIATVSKEGLIKTRTYKGYHDEPLKGKRVGQRSIRLSRSYRAIYTPERVGSVEVIYVQAVNKHDY